MQKDKYYILLFRSIHDVLRAEKILKSRQIGHELVPIPRNLSTDCGMCVRIDGDLEKTLACIGEVTIEKCYCCSGSEYATVAL